MGDRVGELLNIYVSPRFMKRGAGTALLKKGLELLKERNFEKATLWVLSSNEATRKWYARRGWKVEGKTKTEKLGDVGLHETRYWIEL